MEFGPDEDEKQRRFLTRDEGAQAVKVVKEQVNKDKRKIFRKILQPRAKVKDGSEDHGTK